MNNQSSLLTLKSNTMKNTMQIYLIFMLYNTNVAQKCGRLNLFNLSDVVQHILFIAFYKIRTISFCSGHLKISLHNTSE